MRIIPAIDLKDGNVVRLFKGEFTETTVYSDQPLSVAQRYAALAVRDLHIVDLDGARSGTQQNREIVKEIAAQSTLAVQLGGGIRGRDDVAGWLDAGVTRCVLGSVAIYEPQVVIDWIKEFGADHIVLALDVRLGKDGTPVLTAKGWTEDDALSDDELRLLLDTAEKELIRFKSQNGRVMFPTSAHIVTWVK